MSSYKCDHVCDPSDENSLTICSAQSRRPFSENLMSDESRSPHDGDAPEKEDDEDAESGAQEAASKARPRKSLRARSKSETPEPNGVVVKSETPPPVAAKSISPKSVAPRRSVTPKPPGVSAKETPKPPEAVSPKSLSPKSLTPKPPSVRGETPKPPGVKSAGARSRRPPAVKEKTPAPEPVQAKGDAGGKGKGARSRKKGGDHIDGHAAKFFEEGEAIERSTLHSDVRESDASALGLELHPHRRGAFMRYVWITVAVCAVVCLVAFARALAHGNKSAEPAPVVTTAAAPAPEPVVSAAPPPPAAPTAVATATASASAAPAESASAAPDVPLKSALEEKADAQHALDHNKINDAIMSALRSTALDPTDADAWLLLGAAYQMAGKSADARAAFSTCTKEAKKGEVRECQLMLR
jgi:hypothetical protein